VKKKIEENDYEKKKKAASTPEAFGGGALERPCEDALTCVLIFIFISYDCKTTISLSKRG
jgi:hypothetical protein